MSDKIESYRDLKAWQHAMDLAESVYDLTAGFPADERYALCDQMKRAAISVASNIAEGHGRGTRKDYTRFLWIANGSLKELETQLIFAGRRGFVSREEAKPAWDLLQETGKTLHGLLKSLAP